MSADAQILAEEQVPRRFPRLRSGQDAPRDGILGGPLTAIQDTKSTTAAYGSEVRDDERQRFGTVEPVPLRRTQTPA